MNNASLLAAAEMVQAEHVKLNHANIMPKVVIGNPGHEEDFSALSEAKPEMRY